MADKEEEHETTPRGADWEVVSLTASTYAAAPSGDMNITEFKHEEKSDKVETSNPLFMSGHFALPPKEDTEILDHHHHDSESVKDSEKNPDDLRKLTELDDYQIPYSNDDKLALSDTDLTLAAKDESIYSLQSEATMGALNLDDEDESIESSEKIKEVKHDGSGVAYGVWLKKGVVSLYENAKETSAFWSIFAAAAVMGIVIIGQQWQQERWQVLRHEWKSRIHDETGSISRFKEAIVGGNRRDFFVNGSTSRDC